MGLFQPVLSEETRAGSSAGEEVGPPLSCVAVLLDEQGVVGTGPDKEGTHELVMLAVEETTVPS